MKNVLTDRQISLNNLILSQEDVIIKLSAQQQELKAFHVKALFLFGSVVRNEANIDSDVDLLVEFEKPVGLFTFARTQRYLENLFDCAIDLGMPDSLQPYLRDRVLGEAVRVF
jgi:predicted nucleotidyltransferase